MIHLITGPPGAGKSTYSRRLAAETNSVIFSIDEWMGRLYGPDMPVPIELNWVITRVQRCEELIWLTAVDVVRSGGNVILDIGAIKAQQRLRYRSLALELGLDFELHYLTADADLRLSRVLTRNIDQGDTFSFEITPQMFHYMNTAFEAPGPCEDLKLIKTDCDLVVHVNSASCE